MGFIYNNDVRSVTIHAGYPVSFCYRVQFTLCKVTDPDCYLGQLVIQANNEISFAE